MLDTAVLYVSKLGFKSTHPHMMIAQIAIKSDFRPKDIH